jgi:hypothetical protein
MYPILLNSENKGYSFHAFYQRFIEICEEHKTSKKAMVFAFILYDFENAQIAKILEDKDYWLSLNSISGSYLTVFSLHYKPKVRYRRKKDDGMVLYHMTSVRDFHNPSESANILIRQYFGHIEVKYPAVLFFQIQDGQVLDHTLIELNEEEIGPAFLELKTYIKSAVDALKKIEDENKENHQEIFELVKGNVRSERSIKVAKRTVRKITSLTELASTIAGLGK